MLSKNILAACLTLWFMMQTAQAREIVPLNDRWKFVLADDAKASSIDFNDDSWQAISLPHTWNAADSSGGSGSYHRGAGWYRQHIQISAEQAKHSIYIWFGAAGTSADVYINGKLAGSHQGGFQAFCFDISPLVVTGDNVVSARVTNSKNNSIAPLAGDFNVQGGLYRDAHLIVTDHLCISPLDDGSDGVSVVQEEVTANAAKYTVHAIVRNSDTAAKKARLECSVQDAQGNVVVSQAGEQTIDASAAAPATISLSIPQPHLWNGKADPYLYRVTIKLVGDNGESDFVSTRIGVRTYIVDPDKGFFLNGKSYPLHGVNRHQDKQGKGWAITNADMDEDMALCNELGITVIRLAHYQHAQHFYDLCDENGIVVWAELCMVNKIDPSDEFAKVTKQQLTELIKQNINHPAICFWSLYNELQLSGKTEAEHQKQLDLVSDLNKIAHELDPTRLTTAATLQVPTSKMNWIPDIIGFNKYNGWYLHTPDTWASELDKLRAATPGKRIAISEYGAGGSVKQHGFIATTQPLSHFHDKHPEEGQSYIHEFAWKAMRDRPWLWGTFIWNFADFGVSGRNEGDTQGINDKGLLTFDRKTRKDIFYLYKAAWSEEPVLYIAGRRNTPRPDGEVSVHVYSNCTNVQLTINGKSVTAIPGHDEQILVFEKAALVVGENQIEVTGQRSGETVTDHIAIVRAADPPAK